MLDSPSESRQEYRELNSVLRGQQLKWIRGVGALDSTNWVFKGVDSMEDRRRAKRYAFSATAEVVEMTNGARLSTRAADLSERGCYLDSLNPFTLGTNVRIRIGWEGAELKCAATVRDVLPGMGMGVAFTDLNDEQKALIDNWIEKLDSPGQAGLSQTPPLENAKPAPPPDDKDALAVRLIDLMQKKGMLSAYEVASLLRDRNL